MLKKKNLTILYLVSPSLPSVVFDAVDVVEEAAVAMLSSGRSSRAFLMHKDANSRVVLGRAGDSMLKVEGSML